MVYYNIGDYEEARFCFERNLLIYEKIMGRESAPTATTLNNLGLVEASLGNFDLAAKYFTRCLDIMMKVAGSEHPEVANAMHNLAEMYRRQGKYEEAAVLYDKSLKLTVRAFGVENPMVISILGNVAGLAMNLDDTETAAHTFVTLFRSLRPWCTRQFTGLPSADALKMIQRFNFYAEAFHSICADAVSSLSIKAENTGAEHLALNKALLEEVQATQASLEADSRTSTRQSREKLDAIQNQLTHLTETNLDLTQHEARRRQLQSAVTQIEETLAEQNELVSQTIRERKLALTDIARNLPTQSVLAACRA